MQIKTFWIPIKNGSVAEEELNRWMSTRRVVAVEKHFCPGPPEAGWAFCVETVVTPGNSSSSKPPAVDYREILDPDTFALFAALRTRRKEISLEDGVPLFTVMSNENLADIARERCRDVNAIAAIPGIGKARAEKYGARLLEALVSVQGESSQPSESQEKTVKE